MTFKRIFKKGINWGNIEETAQDVCRAIDEEEEQGFETLTGKEFIWVETQEKYIVFADNYNFITLQNKFGKFYSMTYRTFFLNVKEKEFIDFNFMNELNNL